MRNLQGLIVLVAIPLFHDDLFLIIMFFTAECPSKHWASIWMPLAYDITSTYNQHFAAIGKTVNT